VKQKPSDSKDLSFQSTSIMFFRPSNSTKLAEVSDTVPTDTIIPLNAADDTDVLRSVCVVLSYRFDDVLDAEKLRTSFERLLDRPGWRKIGGRLRLNVSEQIRAQLRKEYTVDVQNDRKVES
jgi:hypothetical protein